MVPVDAALTTALAYVSFKRSRQHPSLSPLAYSSLGFSLLAPSSLLCFVSPSPVLSKPVVALGMILVICGTLKSGGFEEAEKVLLLGLALLVPFSLFSLRPPQQMDPPGLGLSLDAPHRPLPRRLYSREHDRVQGI